MPWPQSHDFQDAVLNPEVSFRDADLRACHVVKDQHGLPIPAAGQFGIVYQMVHADGRRWAIKCFTSEVPGRNERYRKIGAHLKANELPFMVGFDYLEEGVYIGGVWYPVVKMEWVEGQTLNKFVGERIDRPALLKVLVEMWPKVAERLRQAQVTHADLQHGNIMLVPGRTENRVSLKLVDYDGMYLPALAGTQSGEVGHPNYQHPQRLAKGTYGPEVDRFSHLVIYTTLTAFMAEGRRLWQKYNHGDNLLFSQADFAKPRESAVLRELWRGDSEELRALTGRLVLATRQRPQDVPELDAALSKGVARPLQESEAQEVERRLGLAAPRPKASAPSPPPTAPPPEPPPRPATFAWKPAVLTLAVAAVVGVIGVLLLAKAIHATFFETGPEPGPAPIVQGGGKTELPPEIPWKKPDETAPDPTPAGETKDDTPKTDTPKTDKPKGADKPPPPGRRTPRVLDVLAGPVQIDYLFRGHLGHEITGPNVLTVDLGGGAGKGGLPAMGGGKMLQDDDGNLARVLKPRHMLVVTAIFPMKQQVEEFRKALLRASVAELRDADELPRFLGINVRRHETRPDGTEEWTPLIQGEPAQKAPTVQAALHRDMREAVFDFASPRALAPVIHEGLVTPVPLLPDYMNYPDLRIKGASWPDPDELIADTPFRPGKPGPGGGPLGPPKGDKGPIAGPKGGGPKGGGPKGGGPFGDAGGEDRLRRIPLKDLSATHPELLARLKGNYNLFHPHGQFPPAAGAGGVPERWVERFGFAAEGQSGKGSGKGLAPPGIKDSAPAAKGGQIYDAIVRFVDVDVKPGHVYKYSIQVRMLNPNVASKEGGGPVGGGPVGGGPGAAAVGELLSVPTETKPFRVPGTFHFFAVDQFELDKMGERDPAVLKRLAKEMPDADHAAFQIHRWFDHADFDRFPISDWAIAERVLVRKGDPIGGLGPILTKVPVWNAGIGGFEMPVTLLPKKKVASGLELDFLPRPDKGIPVAPVLVEIQGGRKNIKVGGAQIADDAATELLIVMPDGKLVLRNSREDAAARIDDASAEGTTRQDRVEHWRRRNRDALEAAGPAGTAMPKLPGGN